MGINLCADLPYDGENPEVYLREYKGDYEHEEFSLNSVFEVEIDSLKKKGFPIKINYKSLKDKNQKADNNIKLRHFLSGRLLCLEDNSIILKSLQMIDKSDDTSTNIGLWSTNVQKKGYVYQNNTINLSINSIFFNKLESSS